MSDTRKNRKKDDTDKLDRLKKVDFKKKKQSVTEEQFDKKRIKNWESIEEDEDGDCYNYEYNQYEP